MELAKLLQERLGICLKAEAAQIILDQYPWLTSRSALEQHTEEVLAFLLASDFNQAGAACLPVDLAVCIPPHSPASPSILPHFDHVGTSLRHDLLHFLT